MPSNKQLIYTNPPSPTIDPSLSGTGTFTLRYTNLPETLNDPPNNDKLLVRVHYLSLDAAMRHWLTAKRSYTTPVERGSVMRAQAIAQVLSVGPNLLQHQNPRFNLKPSDWVIVPSGWQEYAIVSPKEVKKVDLPPGAHPRDAMSVLGVSGLTAYFGMLDIGRPKPSDTVVVSGAAGAAGMLAGQIARIHGAKRVIGIAGSKDKCEFLTRELGFDAAVDYKDPDWKRRLKEVTPEYIDVFFDNVGGEVLDVCLGRAARDARFVICGAVSQYNSDRPQGPSSFLTVIVGFAFFFFSLFSFLVSFAHPLLYRPNE